MQIQIDEYIQVYMIMIKITENAQDANNQSEISLKLSLSYSPNTT